MIMKATLEHNVLEILFKSLSKYIWSADLSSGPPIAQKAKFMGPTWVLSAPDGPHVGPMNLVIRACPGV